MGMFDIDTCPNPGSSSTKDQQGVTLPIFRNLQPCFLGFCLVICVSTLQSLYLGQWIGVSGIATFGWVTSATRIATFLCVAVLSSRIGKLSSYPASPWTACALCVAGLGLTMGTASMPFSTTWLDAERIAGSALGAMGYSLLYLHWIELYARMDLMHAIAYFSLVHLCSAAISLFVNALPMPGLTPIVTSCMPVASCVLYARSLKVSSGMAFMQGEAPSSGWSVPWKPVILLGTYTFANSFVRHFLGNDLKGAVLVGVMLAAGLALGLLARRRERLGLRTLYATSLPLIVAASLCVLIALPGFSTLGGTLSNAAYTLFSIYATVLLCNVAYRDGVGPLWLFGFACASTSLGSLASNLLTSRVDFIAAEPSILTLAVSAVILMFVCLYVAFDAGKESAWAWGITREGGKIDTLTPTSEAEPLDERCARLARRFGLTRREEEVMARLARDIPYSQVENELSIANSTLKTHVRHIYAKLGVTDKRELVKLVESER